MPEEIKLPNIPGTNNANKGNTSTRHEQHFGTFPTAFFGIILIMVGIILGFTDIEATEALFGVGSIVSFSPNWAVAAQIPEILFHVGYTPTVTEATAWIVAWIVYLFSQIMFSGWEITQAAAKHANPNLHDFFGKFAIGCAIFDGLTNLFWGPWKFDGFQIALGNILLHFLFALIATVANIFFLVMGFRMVEHAIRARKK